MPKAANSFLIAPSFHREQLLPSKQPTSLCDSEIKTKQAGQNDDKGIV